ncbi:MAG: hypothetical protein ABEI52_02975 [Halobacteriaceae archaeon]
MPECQYCGETYGNEGAKASHEQFCDLNPNNQGEPQKPAPANNGGGAANTQMATPEQMGNPMEVGMQAAEVARGLSASDPERKAEAKQGLLEMVGSAAMQIGQQAIQQEKEEARRAKERGGETLQEANEYPDCPNCERPVRRIPDKDTFPCPHCGVELTT